MAQPGDIIFHEYDPSDHLRAILTIVIVGYIIKYSSSIFENISMVVIKNFKVQLKYKKVKYFICFSFFIAFKERDNLDDGLGFVYSFIYKED